MHTYYFLEKAKHKPIKIKDGFNIYCLLFGLFWAVYKGVWRLALIFFTVFLISLFLAKFNIVSSSVIEVGRLIISVALSFYANDFLKSSLISKGYQLKALVCAPSSSEALQRFLDKKLDLKY